jgi:hypothetical protein
LVGTGVLVSVGVLVGVTVGVMVGVFVIVAVAVCVGVAVSVGIGVLVAAEVMVGVLVAVEVAVGVLVRVAVAVGVPDTVLYSMCSRGAAAGMRSYALAVRCPVPVTKTARELPLAQPWRFTISCMIGARSGVCWLRPVSPTVVHGGGDQDTVADVLGRAAGERLELVLRNVVALSAACPVRVREVASVLTSSVWN